MNKKTTNLFLLLMFCLIQFSWGEKPSQIIRQLRAAEKNETKRRELSEILKKTQPLDVEDIDALVSLAKEGDEMRWAAEGSFRSIKAPLIPKMKDRFLDLIDGPDETLNMMLRVCMEHKIEGAKERIRARLKREPKTKIDDEEIFKFPYRNLIRSKKINRVGLLGTALAKMGDVDSLDLLFSLDELLCTDSASSVFKPFGSLALDMAVDIAAKERGLRKEGALKVIHNLTSETGKSTIGGATPADNGVIPKLEKLIDHSSPEIRLAAFHAILALKGSDIDSYIESLQKHPDQEIRAVSMRGSAWRQPEKYKQVILDSIYGKGPLEKLDTLYLVSSGRILGIEKELEGFIREEEKRRPNDADYRKLAARGVWKLTGRKIEYKLGKYAVRGIPPSGTYPWEEEK